MYGMYQPMPNIALQNQSINPYQNQFQMNNLSGSNQGLIRVNGIDGAKAYQNLGANSTVALFDANDDLFYIKSTDGAGFPTIRKFRFEEVNEVSPAQGPATTDFVTRQEFEELKGMITNGKFTISESITEDSTN